MDLCCGIRSGKGNRILAAPVLPILPTSQASSASLPLLALSTSLAFPIDFPALVSGGKSIEVGRKLQVFLLVLLAAYCTVNCWSSFYDCHWLRTCQWHKTGSRIIFAMIIKLYLRAVDQRCIFPVSTQSKSPGHRKEGGYQLACPNSFSSWEAFDALHPQQLVVQFRPASSGECTHTAIASQPGKPWVHVRPQQLAGQNPQGSMTSWCFPGHKKQCVRLCC